MKRLSLLNINLCTNQWYSTHWSKRTGFFSLRTISPLVRTDELVLLESRGTDPTQQPCSEDFQHLPLFQQSHHRVFEGDSHYLMMMMMMRMMMMMKSIIINESVNEEHIRHRRRQRTRVSMNIVQYHKENF